ncbi:MAG: hypothetical protein AAGC44_04910 [Planctomycetota bacterium]
MSQPHRQDVIHSFELIQQVISEGVEAGKKTCGGDCANCPCSGEAPKSTAKTHDSEVSDACEKC